MASRASGNSRAPDSMARSFNDSLARTTIDFDPDGQDLTFELYMSQLLLRHLELSGKQFVSCYVEDQERPSGRWMTAP
jgi:hypothetical protein